MILKLKNKFLEFKTLKIMKNWEKLDQPFSFSKLREKLGLGINEMRVILISLESKEKIFRVFDGIALKFTGYKTCKKGILTSWEDFKQSQR